MRVLVDGAYMSHSCCNWLSLIFNGFHRHSASRRDMDATCDAVGLSALSVRSFQKGRAMRAGNLKAFEGAGVDFIDPNGGRPGVDLRT